MKWGVVLPFVVALAVLGIGIFAFLHSGDISILSPHGPIAYQERTVLITTVVLSAFVVIPVFGFLFYFAWKYQSHKTIAKEEHAPNWDHDNWLTETFWWIVPTVIVLFLGVIAWQSSHTLDPYRTLNSETKPVTIQVVALDWKWLFIYPDQHIATVNMVEFPENTPIHFVITADAPMNQFWIPSLGGQIMAMQGMQTELNLMASDKGTYLGKSSEISGQGFASMNFKATSVSEEEFSTWVAATQAAQHPLTANVYQELEKPSSYVPAMTYSSVNENLFDSVMMKYMAMPGM